MLRCAGRVAAVVLPVVGGRGAGARESAGRSDVIEESG
ncbi:uncharacterized protein BCN122_II3286 [Burkholderia cenocepacia]|nr:uncharacterized protein BCN122_II3286 [Burkholderia cenocepacia]